MSARVRLGSTRYCALDRRVVFDAVLHGRVRLVLVGKRHEVVAEHGGNARGELVGQRDAVGRVEVIAVTIRRGAGSAAAAAELAVEVGQVRRAEIALRFVGVVRAEIQTRARRELVAQPQAEAAVDIVIAPGRSKK